VDLGVELGSESRDVGSLRSERGANDQQRGDRVVEEARREKLNARQRREERRKDAS